MRTFVGVTLLVLSWNDMLAKASEPSNSIAEIGAESVLIDDAGCMNLCDSTEACANDPHNHGSYCKFWQSPAVCFGM